MYSLRRKREDSISWTDDGSSSSSDTDFFEEMRHSIVPKTTIKTKGELDLEDLPPIEDLQISVEERELVTIGEVHSIVGKQVVVHAQKDQKPLDLDSVLFLSHDKPLGRIFDVFGPVSKPMYVVRFNSPEDIKKQGITVNDVVYFAPFVRDITSFVFVDVLKLQKGSDASWKDNNEPPAEHLDYSDDEQERIAKQKRRGNNRTRPETALGISSKKSNNDKPDRRIYFGQNHYQNKLTTPYPGDYKFGYDTGKGSLGQSFREETRLPYGTVKGAYGILDETGRQRIIRYTAGKSGFVAEGDVGPNGAAGVAPGPVANPHAAAAPAYQAPAQQYNAYQQYSTTAPQQYSAPAPQQYSAPAPQQYSAPAPQQYSAPAPQQYSSPAPQQYSAPTSQQYSAPATQQYSSLASQQYSSPAPQLYSAPAPQQYSAPAPQLYSAPAPQQYSAPASQQYSAPATQQYSAPATQQYSAPASQQYSAQAARSDGSWDPRKDDPYYLGPAFIGSV